MEYEHCTIIDHERASTASPAMRGNGDHARKRGILTTSLERSGAVKAFLEFTGNTKYIVYQQDDPGMIGCDDCQGAANV